MMKELCFHTIPYAREKENEREKKRERAVENSVWLSAQASWYGGGEKESHHLTTIISSLPTTMKRLH